MGRKTQTQIESTRTKILDCALQTLALHPGASMADIAKAAGVGRATLNRYVSSRKELIVELCMLAIDETQEACAHIDYNQPSALRALEQTLQAITPLGNRFAFLIAQPEGYQVPEVDEGLAKQQRMLLDLCKACQKEGSLRKDMPATWINAVLDTLVYAAWTQVSKGQLSAKQASALMAKTLKQGCASQD